MPRTAIQLKPPNAATQPDFAETEDEVYGLVSVLYHALQGVQGCEHYADDAERAGDDDLVSFFLECRDAQNELARRAKRLLVERIDEATTSERDSDDDGA